MAHAPVLDHLLRFLRKSAPSSSGVSDRELLQRYVGQNDEAAFELLVWRYKTLVWNLCRSVLGDSHAAEDAFQATFLILLRKGASVRKRHTLAGWLSRVAFRVALRARDNRLREVEKEKQRAGHVSCDTSCAVEQAEVHCLLHQEVDRLPEKYRRPVVLCYLQGKTYDEAAQLLDCPKGTLSTRLTQARELLRRRLTAKGIGAASAVAAADLSQSVATANPPALMAATMEMARSYLQYKAACPAVASTPVLKLAQSILRRMVMQRMKVTALWISVLLVLAIGAGWLIQQAGFAKSNNEKTPPAIAQNETSRHQKPKEKKQADASAGKRPTQASELVPLRGRVTFPNGKPAADIKIRAHGDGYVRYATPARPMAITDKQGRYELQVHPNWIYLVFVQDRKWAAPPHTGFAVWPKQPINNLDFKLRPATRVYGRITWGKDRKPVAGQQVLIAQHGTKLLALKDINLPNPKNRKAAVWPRRVEGTTTDKDGRFEIFLGPGNFFAFGPTQAKTQKFTITNEKTFQVNFHLPRPEKGRIAGLVVAGKPLRPVAGAVVRGIYRHPRAGRNLEIKTGKDGRFNAIRELHKTVFYARTPDNKMAGAIEISADASKVAIPIQPLGQAKGRLVDPDGKPLAGKEIWYGVHVPLGDDNAPWRTCFGGKTRTANDGTFQLPRLVVGQLYHVNVTIEKGRWWPVANFRAKDAKPIDLGKCVLTPEYRPPTLDERIAAAFRSKLSPRQRFDAAVADARLSKQHVLVVFAAADGAATKQFYELLFNDRRVRRGFDPYRVTSIAAGGKDSAAAQELAKQLQVRLQKPALPLLCIFDAQGKAIMETEASALIKSGRIDAGELLRFLKVHAPGRLDARKLLADALSRAKKEKKRIILQETATWCSPCRRLAHFLDQHRELWSKDYLWVKIDHRWAHADELMKPIRKGAKGGIPWTAILDADGKVLITSNGADGENIGFPSSAAGIAHFVGMFRGTAMRLTVADLSKLRKALEIR